MSRALLGGRDESILRPRLEGGGALEGSVGDGEALMVGLKMQTRAGTHLCFEPLRFKYRTRCAWH